MINLLTWLGKRRHPYEPLITIELNRQNLLHNLFEFRKLAPGGSVAPVLKSNAYGHGLFEIAKILEQQNRSESYTIPFFAVDSYFEAVALRAKGVKTRLLIIGYTRPETMLNSSLKNVAFSVGSLETLRKIKKSARKIHIHLKIDTGMRRQGIMPEEIPLANECLFDQTDIILEGIFSHLCDADNIDSGFTESQTHTWNRIVRDFRQNFGNIKYVHLGATYGHQFTSDIDANVARLGIGLYGTIDGKSFTPNIDLKPVLQMKTVVTGIKHLKRDETVGYGNSFKAKSDMIIGTIPVGYYEGIDRRLSNCGSVLVGESQTSCPIIGRVSMNISTIDLTKAMDVRIGSTVTVISNDQGKDNCLFKMAETANAIPYELAVHIPAHLKRVVVE